MGITLQVAWTNKDENSEIEITNLKAGNYLLRRLTQIVAGGGSAATHAPTLGTATGFSATTVTEIVRESSVVVANKIDNVYTSPIPFHIDGGADAIGSLFLKLGFDAGATGDDDGTTVIYLEYMGGGKKSV